MSVSIVIVCMNRPDNLYPCLRSIYDHTAADFEVLVVAYMFSEENLAALRADFPSVRIIGSDVIRGFSENNNLALRQVKSDFCFILNDDTVLPEDTVGKLLDDFGKLPDNTAIVAPTLLNADGSLQLRGRCSHNMIRYVLQQWHLWTESRDNTRGLKPVVGEVFTTKDISGAAFLARTDIFRDLGWFDERFFFTPEDIALSTLAIRKGYGVYVDAGTSVIHKWRTTASTIFQATRPAAIRGSMIHFSGGNTAVYLAAGACIWCAEAAKYLKASIRAILHDTPGIRNERQIFLNNCRSIFTHRTPKEIFSGYYANLTR